MTTKTYDKQTAKLLAVIGENMPELSGDVMQGWIENPRSVQKVLKEAFCPPEAIPKFEIWKTIRLGTGLKTADDFRKAIKNGGMKISDWANDILGEPEFTVAAGETEVDLARVTVAELGFKKGASRGQIYERAKELGLELCPPEIGPQLRMQYLDQPKGEWILTGTKPICDADGVLRVFYVEHRDSGLWLYGHSDRPDRVWDAASQWAFVLPRKYQE